MEAARGKKAFGRFAIKISLGPDDSIGITLFLLIDVRKLSEYVQDSTSEPESGTKKETGNFL